MSVTPKHRRRGASTSRGFKLGAQQLDFFLVLAVFVILAGSWELVVRALRVPSIVVPPPSAIAKALWIELGNDTFWQDAAITFGESVGGFLLGAILAVVLGALVAQFRVAEKAFYPYIVMLQTVPKIAVAPLFVLWFGFGLTSKVVIAALVSFFPILVNVIVGLHATRTEEIELIRAFRGSRWQTFIKVLVPNALPFLFAGLDAGIVLSVLGAIVGEFVGSQAGLGARLVQYNFKLDVPGVFAILVALSLMGYGLHFIIQVAQRKLVFWSESSGSITNS